ncbi:MAG: VOC family protein [Chloroflexi bacterium]|nr:VOC family protein [Chloroflexota bacterium]
MPEMRSGLYLDHVLIAVHDLSAAAAAYTALGFKVTPEGRHPGRGTHNRLMAFGPEYLELIAVHDRRARPFRPSMDRFLSSGKGLYMFALGTGDITAASHAIRARGSDVGDPVPGRRDAGESPGYTWRSADLGRVLPGSECFLIQHDHSITERYTQPPQPLVHPNRVSGISHLTLAVRDSAAAARAWHAVLGVRFAPPEPREGALRYRLALGNCFLDLESPTGRGALSEFLATRGEGPFELGLRTVDFEAATTTMGLSGSVVETPEGRSVEIGCSLAAGARLRLVEG